MSVLRLLNSEGRIILGSDGIMSHDKRCSVETLKGKVRERNKKYQRNFPNLLATGFLIWQSQSSNKYNDMSHSKTYNI
jgi:hypothetical protein